MAKTQAQYEREFQAKKPQWGKSPLIQFNPNNVIGDVPFELPLYTSHAVVAEVLHNELPDNDPNYPLWRDEYEQQLANQGGLLGLNACGCGCGGCPSCAEGSGMGVYFGPSTAITKLDGLGAAAQNLDEQKVKGAKGKKTAASAAGDPNIKVTLPEPIKTSTIYAVIGGSALLVLGSVALWAWYRSKKGK